MNVPGGLGHLTLPLNPEMCWRISISLLHTFWQVALLWLFVSFCARQKQLTVHFKFRVAFAALVFAGCLPLVNYVWVASEAVPRPVAIANTEFDSSAMARFFCPSELGLDGSIPEPLLKTDRRFGLPADTGIDSPNNNPVIVNVSGRWQVIVTSVSTIIYFFGVTIMLFRFGKAIDTQSRLNRAASKTLISRTSHPALWSAAEKAAACFSQTIALRVAVYRGPCTAMVIGIFKPIILVNSSMMTGLTPHQIQDVFAHELAHIYRKDPMTLIIRRVVESILFFHPCAWAISNLVSQLRERCCDEHVLRFSDSVAYANTLLCCYELRNRQSSTTGPLALPIDSSRSQLVERIEILLSGEQRPRSSARPGMLSRRARASLALFFFAIATAVLSTRSTQESNAGSVEGTQEFEHEASSWTAVTPINDNAIEPPQLWMSGARLELSSELPDDISVEPMLDPESCQFTQWQFGDARSTPVALLIEQYDGNPERIFLDANRDRTFEAFEELSVRIHDQKVWIAELSAVVGSDKGEMQSSRQVAIYPRKNSVRIRTLGHAEGTIQLEGQTFLARRIDVDGSGVPVESEDQLWIDLNSDRSFDPISERFNLADQLEINGTHFTVRSDRLGHETVLAAQSDLGRLKFELRLSDDSASIEKLEGALRDKNGMLFAVRLTDESISVPAGQYCLEHLVVKIRDKSQVTWRLNLARAVDVGWITVEPNSEERISLLEDFRFAGIPVHDDDFYTGFQSHVQTKVYTPRGLAITDFVKLEAGKREDSFQTASVVTIAEANASAPLGQTRTGFS